MSCDNSQKTYPLSLLKFCNSVFHFLGFIEAKRIKRGRYIYITYLVINIFVGNTFDRAGINSIDPSKEFSGWDSTPVGQQLQIA